MLALLLLPVLLVSGAVARYTRSFSASCVLTHTAEEGQVRLLGTEPDQTGAYAAPDGWQSGGGGKWTEEFLLANGTGTENCCGFDQSAVLTVFVTAGAGEDAVQITLAADGTEYEGKAQRVPEGSPLHEQYGDGWLFRFYGSDEEELSWLLLGSGFTYQRMALTVTGSPRVPAAVSVMAAGYAFA